MIDVDYNQPVFLSLKELHQNDIESKYDVAAADQRTRSNYLIKTNCINCSKKIDYVLNGIKNNYTDLQCDKCKGDDISQAQVKNVFQFIKTIIAIHEGTHNVDELLRSF